MKIFTGVSTKWIVFYMSSSVYIYQSSDNNNFIYVWPWFSIQVIISNVQNMWLGDQVILILCSKKTMIFIWYASMLSCRDIFNMGYSFMRTDDRSVHAPWVLDIQNKVFYVSYNIYCYLVSNKTVTQEIVDKHASWP